jgi:putative PIN family toxin of toxin-antitoxin system
MRREIRHVPPLRAFVSAAHRSLRARYLLRRRKLRWLKPILDPILGIVYDTNVTPRRVVLDTNVIVAALRSRRGASYQLLSLLGEDRFEIAVSVPLVLEYEDALTRDLERGPYGRGEIDDLLDFLCTVAHRQSIFFLWRPCLPDPKDDMVLELAVAARCEAIVTHNGRDFVGTERLGIRIDKPGDFLRTLKEPS